MPGPTDFAKLVPGFDFLQGLMKSAGTTLPNMGQWIAPTLDPADIEKRIEQLRTVQFWLEQNAKMLGATIQALEVQRMTLATLQGMNLPLDDVRQAFTLGMPPAAVRDAAAAGKMADEAVAPASKPRPKAAGKGTASKPAHPVADPMQWWGALTQQFTELASNALRDSSAEAAKHLAGQALKTAVGAATSAATTAAATAASTAASAAKIPARVARAGKRAK
jgi:hypothetical protein